MNPDKKKIYCSLDIETSGFDPLKNEVLEVGLAFFELDEQGLHITEEWECVCKPNGEVPPVILSLTGIRQEELDQAQPFSFYKEEIQKKVKDAVIVGHNIIFDVKFLQGFGIEFSGKTIDTLDLVQFLLPTHHSYNLENLMHLFGVSHKDAHRALADAKACVVVLEQLLRIYGGFSEELKAQIQTLIANREFIWKPLLEASFHNLINKPVVMSATDKSAEYASPSLSNGSFRLTDKTIYNFPTGEDCVENLLQLLAYATEKVLLVLPRQSTVIKLWRQGKVAGVFGPEYLFNEKKFSLLLEKDNLTEEQLRFALKILVWKHTNWQTESIADLNLSFFGGQFRSLIVGGKIVAHKKPQIACTDLGTFEILAEQHLYADRFAVIVGLNEFEQNMSAHLSTKVSWSYIQFILKSYYNPELAKGDELHKEIVSEGLNATDLFFGLTAALLNGEEQAYSYFKVNEHVRNAENFSKVRGAAGHFCDTLERINMELGSQELTTSVQSLRDFFEEEPAKVKWIEFSQRRCVFNSTPLQIHELVKTQLASFKETAFVDSLGLDQIVAYFVQRLGVYDFEVKAADLKAYRQPQGDLFVAMPDVRSVSCQCKPTLANLSELLTLVGPESLPAAVLFGNQTQVKRFSDENFQELKKNSSLLVQNGPGGSRLLRNFSIHDNSLLVATDKFVLKTISTASTNIEHLSVKTLILCHLPFEQFTHPYQEALSATFSKPFDEYSIPKAVYNFHCLLQFFLTPSLERIYICDDKMGKEYAKSFKNYIKSMPFINFME